MTTLLTALGFVLVVEGLLFALAPRRLEDLLRVLADLPVEARRLTGLIAIAIGVGLLSVVRMGHTP